MGKDEQKAFELLDKNRQIQRPIIEQHNGHWIKELGDGVMASFNTASDAVCAAVQIQQTCNSSEEFQVRFGIDLGEAVFENNDVFGMWLENAYQTKDGWLVFLKGDPLLKNLQGDNRYKAFLKKRA